MASVAGDERQDVVGGLHRNAGVVQGLVFRPVHKVEEILVAGKAGSCRVPVADLYVDHSEDAIGARPAEGVEPDQAVIGVVVSLLVIHEGAEHGTAVAQVMAVDGDVPAGRFVVRAGQGEQAAQLAFLAGKQVVQVVCRIVRAHHGVVDDGAGDGEPGHKVPVLCAACRQIHS